ncbi:MAG TPA: mycofactocin oligosaccharide methyltransferase MftM [Mycobacterium sp.]|uniref:mycofactocin oligosaccharide methyltransferase MftM n=1 Tax=Mycolicibacterium sp. TaxID=2320850 RepID=UPI0025D5809E|nr:mycofactocin oligosaccharide methyltransferase MftM [Mycolicibacterium sp.]HPX38428.1 mycofactocin oligosaccharide methyltransferase MftM [Mycobacterium sp.]HQC78563.1 mycofactocin oligosaccharide methyltransferase MftM [Mycobacterium sp.]
MTAPLLGAPARIDPFAPIVEQVWHGVGVTVRRGTGPHIRHGHGPDAVCTERFCAQRLDGLLTVEHRLSPDQLCDELAAMIADDLAGTGMLGSQADFEEVFTGVIRSSVDGAQASWLSFYRNSVARLEAGLAGFSPVHRYGADLIRGAEVIDLGSCFGFFPLRLAAQGIGVLATDLSAPTMGLLSRMSALLGRPVRTMACDATRVPLPDRAADTVTALHLIEHLPPESSDAVIDEAVRLARHRVVIAVPFEAEPVTCYGHVQRFGCEELDGLARRLCHRHPELRATVTEHHGGWLVLDR